MKPERRVAGSMRLVLPALLAVSGFAQTVIPGAPYNVRSSGMYTLPPEGITGSGTIWIEADDVTLDCHGATLKMVGSLYTYAIYAPAPRNFVIRNCNIIAPTWALYVAGGAGLQIRASHFTGTVDVQSNNAIIGNDSWDGAGNGNTFHNGGLNVIHSDNVRVFGNSATNGLGAWNACYGIYGARAPVIANNTCDGGFTSDDGFLFQDVQTASIFSNYSANNWDACYEWVGTFANSVFSGNTAANCGVGGFTSYHLTSWYGNYLYLNTADQVPFLFNLYRGLGDGGLRACPIYGFACPETAVEFHDNYFLGNRMTRQRYQTVGISSNIAMSTSSLGAVIPFHVYNNGIGYNDWDPTAKAPFFYPASGFVDYSGNVCGPAYDGFPTMLSCIKTVPRQFSPVNP